MPVRASFQPSSPPRPPPRGGGARCWGIRPPTPPPKCSGDPAASSPAQYEPRTETPRTGGAEGGHAVKTPRTQELTSDQVGIPAELKHINKRRKRNQQGLPQ